MKELFKHCPLNEVEVESALFLNHTLPPFLSSQIPIPLVHSTTPFNEIVAPLKTTTENSNNSCIKLSAVFTKSTLLFSFFSPFPCFLWWTLTCSKAETVPPLNHSNKSFVFFTTEKCIRPVAAILTTRRLFGSSVMCVLRDCLTLSM